jgi:hypothetical protein
VNDHIGEHRERAVGGFGQAESLLASSIGHAS